MTRNGASVENCLYDIDVYGGGAGDPVGEHFVDRVRFGSVLDLNRVG
ncbi:hypothetical protein [Mycobacterium lepromatosis]|nr:hypothetical protein [Mycobacterium lepromatosis]